MRQHLDIIILRVNSFSWQIVLQKQKKKNHSSSINNAQRTETGELSFAVVCHGAVASVQVTDTTWVIQVCFLSGKLLHHSDNRGRHSANHNLLPNMHLCVPVWHVTMCLTEFVHDVKEVFGEL